MKRMKVAVLVCAVLACVSLLLTGCQNETYQPPAKSPMVSNEALVSPGVLTVGVNAQSAPLAGVANGSSRIVGIDADVAAFLADELGCKVQLVDVGNDPATALANKQVDIVLGVDSSEENAGYWRSISYIQTGVALFGRADEAEVPTADAKPKVAAQESSKSSWRVTNLFGDDSLVAQGDLKSAFVAMNNGDVRYAAADAVIGTYVSHTNGFNDKIVALLQDPSGYCAAVAETNAELQTAITSAMQDLTGGGMMHIIESKWLGSPLQLASVTVVKSAAADASSAAAAKKKN